MLGWDVLVFRNAVPAKDEKSIVHWETGPSGLRWLDNLAKEGKAFDLGGNGYPMRYKISADVLLPIIKGGPPPNDGGAVMGDDYYRAAGWTRTRTFDAAAIDSCAPGQMLLIEAWDQS